MNKASGDDRIPPELFEILKDDAVQMLHSTASKFGNLSSGRRLEKVNFHSNPKEYSNYLTTVLISHASKVMLNILQARLQQYTN